MVPAERFSVGSSSVMRCICSMPFSLRRRSAITVMVYTPLRRTIRPSCYAGVTVATCLSGTSPSPPATGMGSLPRSRGRALSACSPFITTFWS